MTDQHEQETFGEIAIKTKSINLDLDRMLDDTRIRKAQFENELEVLSVVITPELRNLKSELKKLIDVCAAEEVLLLKLKEY